MKKYLPRVVDDVPDEIEGVERENVEVVKGVVVRDGVVHVNEIEGENVSLVNAVCEEPERVQV